MKTTLLNKVGQSLRFALLTCAVFLFGSSTLIAQVNCSCPSNLVLNPSFESGTTSWNWQGGNLSTGTGAVACGASSGDFQISNLSANWVSQTIAIDPVVGTTYNLSVYAGTHDNSFYHEVALNFSDVNWIKLPGSQNIEVNKVLATAPVGPQLYNLSGVAPAGTKYVQVVYHGNNGWIKTDNWCVTSGAPCSNTSNLVSNGNFNTGSVSGFSTDVPSGSYGFTTNPNAVAGDWGHFGDHTTGTGNMMWFSDDQEGITNRKIWYQNYSVTAGQQYTFKGWARNSLTWATAENNPTLKLTVNGNQVGSSSTVSYSSGWNLITATYTPTTSGSQQFAVVLQENDVYFDFVIDDVSITSCNSNTTCDGRITGLYFNKLDGGSDITINNNNSFVASTLGSLYNLEVNTTGTIGSVKYTITGPTSGTNIENASPYNHPSTGTSSSWTPTPGNYSINIKVFNLADATGTQCHDTTLHFVVTAACDPNNVTAANATAFCAPQPNCAAGSFLWSQNINPTNGSPSTIRLHEGGILSFLIPTASYPALLTGGTSVFVNITDVVSYDGYAARGTVSQPNERWRLVFKKAGATVFTSNWTNDVPDNQIQGFWRGALNSATLSIGADQIYIEHWALGTGQSGQGPNSVIPSSICIKIEGVGSIGDKVFFDANGSGIQDAGEGGIAGVTVQLKNGAGTVIATTNTNATGNYLFSNLSADNYIIVFPVSINGSVVTGQNNGGDDNLDSDASQSNGETDLIVLASGQNITNVDAGYCPTFLQLGNKVWNDLNYNGIQDGAEVGIPNLTVKLYKDNNNDNIADGGFISTVTTDASGTYLFSNLAPGNYIIGVTPPAGYISSINGTIDPDNNVNQDDNGVNLIAGEWRGLAITLVAGTESDGTATDLDENTTYDFGFHVIPTCNGRITGLIFNKLDGGTDLQITNGAIFTPAQLGLLYNIETINTGSIGSVRFTITGPTPTTNIENTAPYTTPGSGAWTGAEGTYNVNIKVYSATGATGTLCHDTTISFTLATPTGSIGDRVWFDANGNDIQDATETTGITGVTVELTNAAGTVIATTTTNASGNYLFSGLAAGNYSVVFPPSINGAVVTTANVGADDNIDSDANQTTGATGTITLGVGQNITNVDAGYCPTNLSLGDRVYYDLNNNGVREVATEAGIPSVTVNLYKDNNNDNIPDGAAIATTTTDANGGYRFDNLVPGNYIVGVTPTSGYSSSTNTAIDPDNDTDLDDNGTNLVGAEWRGLAITLTGGGEPLESGNFNNTYDFGFYPTASIGNFVWNDTNGNGVQDAGEPGISGVTVVLTAPGGATTTTTTDTNGAYNFPNLAPTGAGQTYSVAFTTPAGYTSATSNAAGSTEANDSDPIAGVVSGITLTPGLTNNDVDAGFYQVVNLGNIVFYDQNNNGSNDATDPKISGATVNLYRDSNNDGIADGAAVATTTTNATGLYNFTGLKPDTYIVAVVTPAGYAVQTINGGDPDNNTDNDNNGVVVAGTEIRSNPVTLTAGAEPAAAVDGDAANGNLTVDFGFKGNGVIGNFVFNDLNGNGIQDAGEAGIPNATVTLTYTNGATVTTTTDANGSYSFANLAPTGAGQTYSVAFTSPSGFTPATSNAAGSTEANDSDPIAGIVSGITLTPGQVNNDIDAGFFQVVNLGNVVFYDQNNNGINNATDPKISAATVNLYRDSNNDGIADGAAVATTITDASGLYNFTGLKPDTYIVAVVTPAGYAIQSINGGDPDNNTDNDNNGVVVVGTEIRSNPVTLTVGAEPAVDVDGDATNGNLTVDFGFKGTGSIGNFVFNDVNGNGIQDAGEVGIPNATVTLTNPNGTTTTTTTDVNGAYNFPNLAPGSYNVTFTTPSGLTGSPANQGGNDDIDSDPISGTVTGVVLTAGQVNNTVDAGFFAANVMNLGNLVWYDQNNNGIKDGSETGISAATVKLYADANNDNVADGAAVATTSTDANGLYNFSGLAAGNYIVGVNIPSGYAVVTNNGGDPDNNTDNDNNGTNTSIAGEVRSSAITLALTTEPSADGDGNNGNLTVDFGFKGTGSIGNYVFNDVNANGIQDVTETGIAGATVTLTTTINGNSITTITTTNAAGLYSFSNLAPSTYSVAFTTPAGYNVSPSNVSVAGATDANDSDPIAGAVNNIVLGAGEVNETIDAGFYNCVALNSGINGPLTICAGELAVFSATGAGSGSVYNWTFMDGTPASATGLNVSSTWTTLGEFDINLSVTKNGCTSNFTKSIVITQSVFANAGPDADICSGSSTTLVGSGPAGSTYSWIVTAGDPTSIDNGASQSSILVSPLSTTTYQLTVSQNGCTKIDQVTVFINVNKNPVADAGPNRTTLLGTPVVIGGSPTGTAPLATPGAALGYIWSAATGLNNTTIANPSATPTVAGTTNYRVIVYSILTACADTAYVSVTGVQPVNVGNNVWFDKNNNGTKDAGETPLVTVVNLYKDDNADNVPDGAAIATTNSTAGIYNFGNLYPGNYIVGAVIPNGYTAAATTANSALPNSDTDNDNNGTVNTVPTEIRTNTVVLTANGEPVAGTDGDDNNGNQTIDFGFTGTASIGDFVWYDNNRNGIQEAGELGIPNATVTLTYPDGSTLNTTTNASGAYNFPNLAPGSYNVGFTTPAGNVATFSNINTGIGTDLNDSDPIAGAVNGVVLTAGQVNNTVDAGFHNACSYTLKGNVWHDVDGMLDNVLDSVGASTAASIPVGLKVYLVNTTTGKVARFATVTNNGTYIFNSLAPGTYTAILSSTTSVVNVGDNPPSANLPKKWINTGEKLGLTPGSDPLTNGRVNVTFAYECIINLNFGIKNINKDGGID